MLLGLLLLIPLMCLEAGGDESVVVAMGAGMRDANAPELRQGRRLHGEAELHGDDEAPGAVLRGAALRGDGPAPHP